MAGRASSLGPLLIISAIDLLLCCLTAAVMLFLIFQPSQRADRSSALFQGMGGASSGQMTAGGPQAPTIVIVDNSGETPLIAAAGTGDYRQIRSASGKSTTFLSDGSAVPLHLVPADPSKPFVAHIAVTQDGRLSSANWRCLGGNPSEVTVDASSEPPVTMACPNSCVTADQAGLEGDIHLVLLPKDTLTPAFVPSESCYALAPNESFDQIRSKAARCSPNADPTGQEFSSDGYRCLWMSFRESADQNCEQLQSDRVGFWRGVVNRVPDQQICPSPTNE